MTTKEQIIRYVLNMDDAEADRLWRQLTPVAGVGNGNGGIAAAERIDTAADHVPEQAVGTRPPDDDHPIWGIVGIGSSAEPSDIANHKDEYIADAIEHGWQ